eukprot:93563-Hanusia_phi.AAC.1
MRGREDELLTIDNRWVVPYSPLLLRMFEAHINVELCSSVKSIKYICSYICKGSDAAVIDVQRSGNQQEDDAQPGSRRLIDEVEEYQQG